MQINVLNNALKRKSPVQQAKNRKLKERIWHSPVEVIGGIVIGAILTVLLYQVYITTSFFS
jgi:acid phosphatase family membrane protein YuiD